MRALRERARQTSARMKHLTGVVPKSDSLPEFDSPRVNAHDVILCRQLLKQTDIRRRKLANTLHLVCLCLIVYLALIYVFTKWMVLLCFYRLCVFTTVKRKQGFVKSA